MPEQDAPKKRRKAKTPQHRNGQASTNDDPYSAPAAPRRSKRTSKKTTTGQTTPSEFFKKLLLPYGILLGIAVLLIIGGFFSEYAALAATGFLCVVIIACIICGRIWMAVDIGKTSVGLGIAALLVPLVGLVISFRDKGPSLRGAITLISSFVFILPLGLTLMLFAPDSSGRSAFGPRAPSKAMNPESWADRIESYNDGLTDDSAVITFNGTARPRAAGAIEDLAAQGDSLLSRFPGYVKGSFSVDTTDRAVTFQFRGEERQAKAYGFYVGLSTNNHVMTP